MKKLLLISLYICLLAPFVFTGCGTEDAETGTSAPVTAETRDPETPVVEEADESTIEEPDEFPETKPSSSEDNGLPSVPVIRTEVIQPDNLVYQGAFRLPDEYVEIWGDRVDFWSYAGTGMTFYPGGDPSGAADGFPGSLFAVGHDLSQYVSEISIPAPVISRNVAALPIAATLQEPADITGGMFGELELPAQGLAFLPAGEERETDRLYFCWGQHFQGTEASHGWCGLDLSNPMPEGPWHFGGFTNYVTNDYLFDIPDEWSEKYAPGMTLASGRFREGVWGGFGPPLFAWNPGADGDAPPPGTTLSAITPLLLYGTQDPGQIEITTTPQTRMEIYSEPDSWSGGAWLTAGERSTVVFTGTKAVGDFWYGFANGVVWEYDCADHNPPTCPDVPEWPYSDRGYWAEAIESRILFFDPADLAAVATGQMESWEPQPYASWCIDDYLYDPGYDHERGKRQIIGACAFDRENGIFYVAERMVPDDDEKCIIHVWKIAE